MSSRTKIGDTISFSVAVVDWQAGSAQLTEVRTEVFVREQDVPPEVEIDGLDPECVHVLARSAAGDAIGAGRLMPDGRIGRMAVLREWRGRGVGEALLDALIAHARERGLPEAYLHAQVQAAAFYARYGFVAEGEPYLEAGIPHVLMRRRRSVDDTGTRATSNRATPRD